MVLSNDWPNRFLELCLQSKGRYSVFAQDVDRLPYWIASVLRQNLMVCRARLNRDEAEAIAAVAERVTGKSNISVARQFSGRDVANVLARPCISEDVVDVLIASIDHSVSRSNGIRRALLLRDKVMFIAARRMHLSIPRLLALDERAYVASGDFSFSFWGRINTPEQVADMLRWYSNKIRPQLVRDVGVKSLFVACGGGALKLSAVGFRFTKVVREAGLSRDIPTWNHWIRLLSTS
jgi:hypothetical protein